LDVGDTCGVGDVSDRGHPVALVVPGHGDDRDAGEIVGDHDRAKLVVVDMVATGGGCRHPPELSVCLLGHDGTRVPVSMAWSNPEGWRVCKTAQASLRRASASLELTSTGPDRAIGVGFGRRAARTRGRGGSVTSMSVGGCADSAPPGDVELARRESRQWMPPEARAPDSAVVDVQLIQVARVTDLSEPLTLHSPF